MSREDDEGFLARWSRRKTAEQVAEPVAEQGADDGADKAAPQAAEKAEAPFDLSQLPSLESLGKDSDYSLFMQKGVPEDLRLKAIRRMWQTDPSIAGPDLLDMHAWDYTGTEGLRPLVAPAIEAVAAVAKELMERSKDTPDAAKPDSPGEPPEAQASSAVPKDEDRG